MAGAAKRMATGLEIRGDGNVRGSTPPPTSNLNVHVA